MPQLEKKNNTREGYRTADCSYTIRGDAKLSAWINQATLSTRKMRNNIKINIFCTYIQDEID